MRWRALLGGAETVLTFLAVVTLATTLLAVWPGAGRGRAEAATLAETRAEAAAARRQLSRLQAELDDLAGSYSRAEARLYDIDQAVERAEKDEARSRTDLDRMREQFSQRVVSLYKGNRSSLPAFLELLFVRGDFSLIVERVSMLNKVASQDQETLTEVGTHLRKVEALQKDLAGKRTEQKQQLAGLIATQTAMEDRMRATASEYKRLKKKVATLEEAARRAAAAERARARGVANASPGSTAAARGFVFPVDGPHSYINDWGFARSGGRSHKGTDIMAARGTPTVAAVSGRIRSTRYGSGLGGTIIWLDGNNGTSYYYAHLDGIASGIRPGTSVSAGQTIGYVGDSGNARGGACHLHFEIHPGGGGAINPYYVLRSSD